VVYGYFIVLALLHIIFSCEDIKNIKSLNIIHTWKNLEETFNLKCPVYPEKSIVCKPESVTRCGKYILADGEHFWHLL